VPHENAFMPGIDDPLDTKFEDAKQKLEKLKIDTENMAKRLRGEEIPSDKEVEGDLDVVPSKFEAEHGLKPERIDELVDLLLAAVEEEQSNE
jgi:hypothetical protein